MLRRREQRKKKIKQVKLRENWCDRVRGTAVVSEHQKGAGGVVQGNWGSAHHAEQLGIQDIRGDQHVSYTEYTA